LLLLCIIGRAADLREAQDIVAEAQSIAKAEDNLANELSDLVDAASDMLQLAEYFAAAADAGLGEGIADADALESHALAELDPVAKAAVKFLSLTKRNETRWNGNFTMIHRVLKLKEAIELYFSKHAPADKRRLTLDEWNLIRQLVSVLQPFYMVSKIA
jgi:hypothetical protein